MTDKTSTSDRSLQHKAIHDLLKVCISPPSAGTSGRVSHYAEQVTDWDTCLAVLRHHRLEAQTYVHARNMAFKGFPDSTTMALSMLYEANIKRQAAMRVALEATVTELGRHNIPSICLRGPALADLLYAEPTTRHFDDLDVIVPKSDMLRARSVLTGMSYYPLTELPPFLDKKLVNAGSPRLLKQPNVDFVTHLSWCVAPRYFRYEPIDWNRELVEMTLEGEGIRTLIAEDYVLVLCAHGTQFMWSKLCWVADVATLLERKGLDWDRVIALAQRTGGMRMLLTAIILAHLMCDCAIPAPVQPWVDRDRSTWVMAKRVVDRHAAKLRFNAQDDARDAVFHLRCRERIRDRLHYTVFRLLAPSINDFGAILLPAALYPLYYMLRPIRLISRLLCRV